MTEHQDFFNAYGEAAGSPEGHEVSHENFTKFLLDQGNHTFILPDWTLEKWALSSLLSRI